MGLISGSITYDLVAVVATILVGLIGYLKWKLYYWDRVGLPTLSPVLPFGDVKDVLLGRKTFGEQFRDFYRELKAKGLKHGGVYFGPKPFYIPTDLNIIKHIMQTDFQHFMNHANYLDKELDPLSGHLFSLRDTEWRNMRVKLTPTFTSGKMKMMFQTLVDCGVGLKDIMDQASNSGSGVDIKDILGRFSTDIIGSCAFGLDCNSLKDPDAEFRKYGKKVFEVGISTRIKVLLQLALPHSVLRLIRFKFTKADVEKFFMKAIKETVEYREKNHIYRKDFMHLLLQLKNRGRVEDDERITDESGKIQDKVLTLNELSAQAFIFFLAGFETSSTTMTFALFEIATNTEVQEKLRAEINTILSKYDGKLTYEGAMEMSYMENVLHETLRKYPPVPTLSRMCTKDYTIPNTNIRLKKGVSVAISALGLQTDPEYFPNPEKFDPDRFLPENRSSRPAYTWMPFGEGPRLCIGLRFGMLQSKIGLATLLSNYQIKLSKKTKLPLTLDKKSFITAAEGDVWIEVEKLK